jgi:protein-disulfide isomerase
MSPAGSDDDDLTRKQRREAARADRKAAEQAQMAAAARRTRLTQLGIVVSVVVVAIVVILVATGGGSKKPPSKEETPKIAKEVETNLAGIPQQGNALGKPTAPVTVQYYGDLQCPFCGEFSDKALPSIIKNDVRSGKLRIEYRALETATHEPEIFRTQQVAALAAGKQNKLWNFIEAFYKSQGEEDSGYVNEAFLQGLASRITGLNLSKWSSDRSNAQLIEEVVADGQAASQAGFNGTPSFSIGRTGGELKKLDFTSFTDPSSFEDAVDKLAS